jgi:hypothetical protein
MLGQCRYFAKMELVWMIPLFGWAFWVRDVLVYASLGNEGGWSSLRQPGKGTVVGGRDRSSTGNGHDPRFAQLDQRSTINTVRLPNSSPAVLFPVATIVISPTLQRQVHL